MSWRARFAAVLLVVTPVAAGSARAQTAVPPERALLIKKGGDAYVQGRCDEAVSHLKAALELAPDDAFVRSRLRRALDCRARICDARAAKPPPRSDAMSDDRDVVVTLKDSRWRTQLKREALEARADAEAAHLHPSEKKIAKLRHDAAALEAEEDQLNKKISAAEIAADEERDAENQAAEEKAIPGVEGVGRAPSRTP